MNELPREPVTILPGGGPGIPPVQIRDHGAWQAQVLEEKRRKKDEVIDATVAAIHEGKAERDRAPRPHLSDLADSARASMALAREQADEPQRVLDELAELDAWALQAEAERAASPPPDPRAGARRRDEAASMYYLQQRQG